MITYRNAQSQTEMNLTVWRTLEIIKLYEQFESEICDAETQVNFQLEQVEQLSQDELLIIQKRLQREKNGIQLKGKGMPQDNFDELFMQNQEFFIEIATSPDLDLFLISFEEKETQMNVDEQFLKKFETFVFNKIAEHFSYPANKLKIPGKIINSYQLQNINSIKKALICKKIAKLEIDFTQIKQLLQITENKQCHNYIQTLEQKYLDKWTNDEIAKVRQRISLLWKGMKDDNLKNKKKTVKELIIGEFKIKQQYQKNFKQIDNIINYTFRNILGQTDTDED
ncbi:Hypothetical_protein [Hexamita inflata]|uniref:Hypothetical_protein n=1 Tax=Hexamita inflata TaxID=28002 RepID=A0AA86QMR6_9EUKA|nr:Hypothetical protein HINF_LOCUS48778 [Hexamita inflata]